MPTAFLHAQSEYEWRGAKEVAEAWKAFGTLRAQDSHEVRRHAQACSLA